MTNTANIPTFPETTGITPEEQAVLQGIPVAGATVAEPLSHEAAQGFVDAVENELPTSTPKPDVYPGDFTDEDRAMLQFVHATFAEFAPAMVRIREFADALTPEVVEDAKTKLGNPLAQRLLRNILPR
jgi:hypothetical protein